MTWEKEKTYGSDDLLVKPTLVCCIRVMFSHVVPFLQREIQHQAKCTIVQRLPKSIFQRMNLKRRRKVSWTFICFITFQLPFIFFHSFPSTYPPPHLGPKMGKPLPVFLYSSSRGLDLSLSLGRHMYPRSSFASFFGRTGETDRMERDARTVSHDCRSQYRWDEMWMI